MILKIKISDILFQIYANDDITIDKSILHFVYQGNEFDEIVNVHVYHIDDFPVLNAKIMHVIDERMVVMNDKLENREYRLLFHSIYKVPYALYKEISYNKNEIYFIKKMMADICINYDFLECMALEKHLLNKNSFILHSSSILVNGKVILFSAPSGVGKSTQATLWNNYRNVEILNGDRNIISISQEGSIKVFGFPFCGSSNVNKNFDYPLKAIVILSQNKVDCIEDLTEIQKFIKIYSELTINVWNKEYINKIIELTKILLNSVKICHLKCTANVTAVECLEKYLEE